MFWMGARRVRCVKGEFFLRSECSPRPLGVVWPWIQPWEGAGQGLIFIHPHCIYMGNVSTNSWLVSNKSLHFLPLIFWGLVVLWSMKCAKWRGDNAKMCSRVLFFRGVFPCSKSKVKIVWHSFSNTIQTGHLKLDAGYLIGVTWRKLAFFFAPCTSCRLVRFSLYLIDVHDLISLFLFSYDILTLIPRGVDQRPSERGLGAHERIVSLLLGVDFLHVRLYWLWMLTFGH